tara:strand:- start:1080 stop:1331 length:252 start_codon:yes stop_codon:yes gene_type:complete
MSIFNITRRLHLVSLSQMDKVVDNNGNDWTYTNIVEDTKHLEKYLHQLMESSTDGEALVISLRLRAALKDSAERTVDNIMDTY